MWLTQLGAARQLGYPAGYAVTAANASLTRERNRYASIHTAVAITSKWHAIDGPIAITAFLSKAIKLRIVHPMPAVMDAMHNIRAHSHNSNTPIARQAAIPARTSSENPPATPIPAIATEAGSPASSPVIPMTATTKKATAPEARIAAPKSVRTAMIVTPLGLFTLLPFAPALR